MHDERLRAARASRTFTAHRNEVAAVREFVGDCAGSWGLDSGDVVLIASELATNAVLHGRTEFVVTIQIDGHVLRLEVDDRSADPLTPVPLSPTATSGRGLAMVAALADEWGVDRRAGGKGVWTEIRLQAG